MANESANKNPHREFRCGTLPANRKGIGWVLEQRFADGAGLPYLLRCTARKGRELWTEAGVGFEIVREECASLVERWAGDGDARSKGLRYRHWADGSANERLERTGEVERDFLLLRWWDMGACLMNAMDEGWKDGLGLGRFLLGKRTCAMASRLL